jgi:hypothetical protein
VRCVRPILRGYLIRRVRMGVDKVVAVGLLTQRDLDVLGAGFARMYPVERCELFQELIEKLDPVPSVGQPLSHDLQRNS